MRKRTSISESYSIQTGKCKRKGFKKRRRGQRTAHNPVLQKWRLNEENKDTVGTDLDHDLQLSSAGGQGKKCFRLFAHYEGGDEGRGRAKNHACAT